MRRLGRQGRFANQLFQYAFLRIASKDDYQCPSWVGQVLFGHDDPPITVRLPRISERKTYDYKDSVVAGLDNVDIAGHFQYHTRFYATHQEYFRSLFQSTPSILKDMDIVDHADCTLVGIHLRRGDYGTFKRPSARWCFVAPTEWYRIWLGQHWGALKNPLLFIASDEPEKVVDDFRDYDPVLVHSEFKVAPYYPDFYILSQCDILLISNSSFGFAASMLNKKATQFYRPRLSEKSLIPYDPWNSYTVLTDERY